MQPGCKNFVCIFASMNKKLKHIKLILVFFLGFTVVSHAVIPHNHNFGHTIKYNNPDNSDKEPVHCHYLNNIDFDKVRTNSFTKVFKKLPGIFTITFSDILYIDLNYQISNLINTNDNLPDYFSLISISPTRGSPLL